MALIGLKFKCFINMCVHVFMCEFHIYSKSKGKKTSQWISSPLDRLCDEAYNFYEVLSVIRYFNTLLLWLLL